jgi:hypothetical protein
VAVNGATSKQIMGLQQGDGVAFSEEISASVAAGSDGAEMLLFDLV